MYLNYFVLFSFVPIGICILIYMSRIPKVKSILRDRDYTWDFLDNYVNTWKIIRVAKSKNISRNDRKYLVDTLIVLFVGYILMIISFVIFFLYTDEILDK